MPLTYKDVAEILKIIDASDCEELVVELDGVRLVVRRHGAAGQARADYRSGETRVSGPAEEFESGSPAPYAPQDQTKSGADDAQGPGDTAQADGRIAVRAPMIGTFYRRPSPQDPPYVEVGDTVAPGDPLGLIEVMKLYTTVEAEHAGRIVEIGPEDEAAVETDQLLFVIEPL